MIEVNLKGCVVQVDVIDQGIGVSELDQQQLFTKFFRTEEVRRKGIHGTGLGLYITRSLVGMQQGRVWVKSQPGTGSTFSVALPRAEVQPRRVEPPQPLS
jgi:signal transduction histidine kinase